MVGGRKSVRREGERHITVQNGNEHRERERERERDRDRQTTDNRHRQMLVPATCECISGTDLRRQFGRSATLR